ncbi:MAG: GAF domain-containing protein, partial [Candidatus Promineifilaceae bacterium]
MTSSLGQTDDLLAAYETVLAGLEQGLSDLGFGLVLLEAAHTPKLVAWRGLTPASHQSLAAYTPRLETRKPLQFPDVKEADDPDLQLKNHLAANIRALAFIPLLHNKRLLGHIILVSEQTHRFSKKEIKFAEIGASHIANAIVQHQEHAQLEDRLEKRMALLKQQINQRKGSEMLLEQAHQTTEMLRTANVALTQSLDLDTILEIFLDYLQQLIGYEDGAILLHEWESFFRVYDGGGHHEDSSHRQPVRLNIDIPAFRPAREVVDRQQSLIIDNLDSDLNSLFFGHECGVQGSWLGVPLLGQEKAIGLCSLEHADPHYFTERHRQLAEALAAQATVAIHNAQLFNQVRRGRERMRRLVSRIATAQEEERRRISRELHDEASQMLTALKLSLELAIAEPVEVPDTIRANLREAIDLADETMERIRLLAHGLHPLTLDKLGLSSALESLCNDIAQRAHLSITYTGCELTQLTDSVKM